MSYSASISLGDNYTETKHLFIQHERHLKMNYNDSQNRNTAYNMGLVKVAGLVLRQAQYCWLRLIIVVDLED